MQYIVYILLALSLSSFTPDSLQDISFVLKHVETEGRVDAVGDNGRAYGILQIHKGAILDVNRRFNTNYRHIDAFDEVCSDEIFFLYISLGIELYEKKHKRSPSEEEIVRWWNGGIYRGHMKKSTRKYYDRYRKYKKQLC